MHRIMNILYLLLGSVMLFCFRLTGSYGLSIIIFTLLTKLLLFPLALLLQRNAIKMVQLMPEQHKLKIKYIDDKDAYTDAQLALYKKHGYHPLLDLIPLAVQIILVLGVVGVIYRPLSYALGMDSGLTETFRRWFVLLPNANPEDHAWQIEVIRQIKQGTVTGNPVLADAEQAIRSLNLHFLGLDLTQRPSLAAEPLLLIPVFAGISAWLMCAFQNRINVLQRVQPAWNRIGVMLISITISVYFAFLVPAGVGLYWIFGNLFSMLSTAAVNAVMPPKKYVDFAYLKQLEQEQKQAEERRRASRKRERADYKRFFAVKNMQLMFYSEANGYYKYFKGMIEYICAHSDIPIHYVTSDPNDKLFSQHPEQLHPYYISSEQYLIPLFMKLDCDVCVMTMPDLEKYHIKRSRVSKKIEYVYTDHALGSAAMTYRKHAFDWFDTVFCTGVEFRDAIREMETLYGTPQKRLVEAGYPLLDDMIRAYRENTPPANDPPHILIAPSWHPDNIVDSCAEQLLDALSAAGYTVTLRPHPQQVRLEPEKFALLKDKYQANDNIEIQTDFSSTDSVWAADLLISDWSSIAFEYAFTTLKPVLFIETPMKVMNPDYDKIATQPITITMRTEVGKVVKPDALADAADIVSEMLAARDAYRESIRAAYDKHVYNHGNSAVVSGRYIIKAVRHEL